MRAARWNQPLAIARSPRRIRWSSATQSASIAARRMSPFRRLSRYARSRASMHVATSSTHHAAQLSPSRASTVSRASSSCSKIARASAQAPRASAPLPSWFRSPIDAISAFVRTVIGLHGSANGEDFAAAYACETARFVRPGAVPGAIPSDERRRFARWFVSSRGRSDPWLCGNAPAGTRRTPSSRRRSGVRRG
jgi:hypothetical protein